MDTFGRICLNEFTPNSNSVKKEFENSEFVRPYLGLTQKWSLYPDDNISWMMTSGWCISFQVNWGVNIFFQYSIFVEKLCAENCRKKIKFLFSDYLHYSCLNKAQNISLILNPEKLNWANMRKPWIVLFKSNSLFEKNKKLLVCYITSMLSMSYLKFNWKKNKIK